MKLENSSYPRRHRYAMLLSTTLIFSIATLASATHTLAAETAEAGVGLITITGKTGDVLDPENNSQASCQLSIPNTAAGRTITYRINNPASSCYEIRAQTIKIENAPSAVSILLTDDLHCSTELGSDYLARRDAESNKNFFIELETRLANSTLATESLSALPSYTGKFLTNIDAEGNQSKGFKVKRAAAQTNQRITYNLSCVRVTVSAGPSTPKMETVQFETPTDWAHKIKEGTDAEFNCPAKTAIVGRKHIGNERADTHYKCATLGSSVVFASSAWSKAFPECGYRIKGDDSDDFTTCTDAINYDKKNQDYIYFTCNTDEVMTGRYHDGDENALSKIRCAKIYKSSEIPENQITLVPQAWQGPVSEHQSDYTCPANEVLIGRAHRSDEQGYTKWQCASLKAPVTTIN